VVSSFEKRTTVRKQKVELAAFFPLSFFLFIFLISPLAPRGKKGKIERCSLFVCKIKPNQRVHGLRSARIG
jgi:hypothetical protein